MGRGPVQRKILSSATRHDEATSSFNLGGGVWRLKWHPDPRHSELLAAACMYNGAHVLALDGLTSASGNPNEDDAITVTPLAHHTGHTSITYGIEWVRRQALPELMRGGDSGGATGGSDGTGAASSSTMMTLASCSFYDRTLHLWRAGVGR